jgi:glycosyltransferase involved in cell wall biosynthesis
MIYEINLRVLIELRPAADGYAGIPQETRLLFSGFSCQSNIALEGLWQTSFQFLPKGVSKKNNEQENSEKTNNFSKIVIALSTAGVKKSLFSEIRKYLERRFFTIKIVLKERFSKSRNCIETTAFHSDGFEDFIWRGFFEKTLPSSDFNVVSKKNMQVASVPWGVMQMVGMWSLRLFGKAAYPLLNLASADIFIAQTPYPAKLIGNTKLIVRYHDAVPIFLPHTIGHKEKHQANHYYALLNNVKSGAFFACVSEATRQDLIKLFPEVVDRSVTIHNMCSNHYHQENKDEGYAKTIIRSRLSVDKSLIPEFTSLDNQEKFFLDKISLKPLRYLLMVSTLEPRKNHQCLIKAWEQIRIKEDSDLKLVFVGNRGWDVNDLLPAIRPWINQGELFVLNNVPAHELCALYRNAEATICPSYAEGFDYSGVESMQSGGRVIASDIPVHQEVYSDAAVYFNPYDSQTLIDAITKLLYHGNANQFAARIDEAAKRIASRYTPENIMPKWRELLQLVVNRP